MATKADIVPFEAPVDDRTDDAVAGEVITPEDELRTNERIIRKNWQKATTSATEVYKSLTIIHTKNLWKHHLDADGKRKYTAFSDYLFGEFKWNLDRTRALQIIKQTRKDMLESGELSEADMPAERQRSAPEVTASKAATVTIAQFQKVLNAFGDRLGNIEYGSGRDDLELIYEDANTAITAILSNLQRIVDNETQRIADEKEAADTAKMEAAVSPKRNGAGK